MIDLGNLWATSITRFELELVPFRTISIETWDDDQGKNFEIKLSQVERLEFGDAKPNCDWRFAELASVECVKLSDSTKTEVHFEIWGSVNVTVVCENVSIREIRGSDQPNGRC